MTARARLRARLLSAAAAVVLVAGLGAGAGALQETHSAWTDATHASAAVTAGTWDAPTTGANECVVMNHDGTPRAGGTCRVTSLVFDQWGTDALHHRNYYVTVDSNVSDGYIRLSLDLSIGTLRGDTGTGTWKWGNAATVAGNITTTSTCASLPAYTADTPTLWGWRDFYFQVVDDKSAVSPGSITCR